MAILTQPRFVPTGDRVVDHNFKQATEFNRKVVAEHEEYGHFDQIYHGDKTVRIPWMAGTDISGTWTKTNYLYITPDDINRVWNIPIPLQAGSRIKSIVTTVMNGGGSINLHFRQVDEDALTVKTLKQVTDTTGTAAGSLVAMHELNVKVLPKRWYILHFLSGHANDRLYSINVTYDRPEN